MIAVRTRSPQRGAALLLAMLILTLVATLAAGMVWQQWRALQVEAAERARAQSAWILSGALDWARLILREDKRENDRETSRGGAADHLGEPWAVPLAEARLSSFLAADRDNNSAAEADGVEAFLSGSITDAQSRWNLRQLVNDKGVVVEAQQRVLQRLCDQAGVPGDSAERITQALSKAFARNVAPTTAGVGAAIEPQRLADLLWLGIDADTLRRLEPWVILLPDLAAPVNVNTAPAEVIAAAVAGMSLGRAQRLVQDRQHTPMRNLNVAPARDYFPAGPPDLLASVGASSSHFIVQGRLRLGERVLEERSLVLRRGLDIVVVSRERVNLRESN